MVFLTFLLTDSVPCTMNYYEQFYDDLEFEEEDRYKKGPNVYDDFDARNYRQKPYAKKEEKWERDKGQRGQGRGRGKNRGQGHMSGQGPGRGKGFKKGGIKGKQDYKMMNFVKAGELNPDTEMPVVTYPTNKENAGESQQSNSTVTEQTRLYDSNFVNQSAADSSYNVGYVNPLYGYGEGSDFSSYTAQQQSGSKEIYPPGTEPSGGDSAMYAANYDSTYYSGYENQQSDYDSYNYWAQQGTSNMSDYTYDGKMDWMGQNQVTGNYGMEPKPKNKKAMVVPNMNFVKSKTEFKSTDISDPASEKQHTETVPKTGAKRAGLGFGKSTAVVSKQGQVDLSNQDGSFMKLAEAVKSRYAPSRNAVEVLNMGVQKVKNMSLDFDISPAVSYLANFQCIVTVNGVQVGKADDSKKKTAKTKACAEAVALLISNKPLTVRKVAEGGYVLKPKVVDVIHPSTQTESTSGKKVYAPSQGGVVTNKASPSLSLPASHCSTEQPSQPVTAYSKPKIVFHTKGQTSISAPQPLTGFVKEGQVPVDIEKFEQNSNDKTSTSASKPLPGFVKEGDVSKDTTTVQQNSNQKGQNLPQKPLANLVTPKKKGQAQNAPCTDIQDLSKFILFKMAYANPNNASFLGGSASFNRTSISYEYCTCAEGFECSVMIGGNEVGTGTGETKAESKTAATDDAVRFLEDICYTIVVKVQTGYDTNPTEIAKSDLFGNGQDNLQDDALPSSNVGNALLRKMGWVGGGIGKDGTGIAEPIKAYKVIGRKGLGHMSGKSDMEFKEKVRKVLEEFAYSDSENEIHFSAELTKEERASIHQMADRMKLKSVSRGKGENRFLTISRRRSLNELLNHVIESGGSTEKYNIIPPRNVDITYDICRRDAGAIGHTKQ